MTDKLEMFAAYFRGERAIAAARRFISRNANPVLRRSDVVVFLRGRRDRLSEADIEHCATEALERWLASRANRYSAGRRRRGDSDEPAP
jgi:hypothetical protein